MCVRTILPGRDFIRDDLHYYSCAHSVYSTTQVQYAQSRTAAALFTLQWDWVFLIFFFFTTLKGVLTLPRAVFVNITHDTIRVQQKCLSCSLHMQF